MSGRFDIRQSLIGYQQRILGNHQAVRGMTAHPTVMGDQSEQDWAAILRNFLPERYEVGSIIAVDSNGEQSAQIDVGIFDRQYSPLWFGRQGATRIVPVESVYGAFEVKPQMNKQYIEYAASKVASVRRLHRTSAPIIHAGGKFKAIDAGERPIVGGLLTTTTDWTSTKGAIKALDEYLPDCGDIGFLNVGIALDTISFDHTPQPVAGDDTATASHPPRVYRHDGNQLIHFAARLFRLLQMTGTVLAIDMSAYEQHIVPEADSET
jgi:hypothetical protein